MVLYEQMVQIPLILFLFISFIKFLSIHFLWIVLLSVYLSWINMFWGFYACVSLYKHIWLVSTDLLGYKGVTYVTKFLKDAAPPLPSRERAWDPLFTGIHLKSTVIQLVCWITWDLGLCIMRTSCNGLSISSWLIFPMIDILYCCLKISNQLNKQLLCM